MYPVTVVADCEGYYLRGYRQSGDYIIYPRKAVHSIKVRCIMHPSADDGGEDDGGDSSRGDDNRREVSGVDTGGWTVIQQRNSGKVSSGVWYNRGTLAR